MYYVCDSFQLFVNDCSRYTMGNMNNPQKTPKRRRPSRRTFDRSEYIGARCPRDLKGKLESLARRSFRDSSSLLLEFVAAGIAREEAQLAQVAREVTCG